jgi:hypothetical protein
MKTKVAALLCATLAGYAQAHGGGLNGEGCHNNRKTGDYHCHRAPVQAAQQKVAPQRTPAGTQLQPQAKRGQANPQAAANLQANGLPPGCFVGPRGGTYTITASGRKNYGGC